MVRFDRCGELDVVVDGITDFGGLRRFCDLRSVDLTGPSRDIPVVFCHKLLRLLYFDVPGQDKAGVVGDIECFVELVELVVRGAVDVLRRPDGDPPVRVHPVCMGKRLLEKGTVRAVFQRLFSFLLDHTPLRFDPGGVDPELEHPLRLHVHGQFDLIGGERDVVDGLVEAGEGIQLAPRILYHLEELTSWNVRRPFEHQVFEEVREPCPVRLLVLGSDVVRHNLRDNRDGFVLMQDDMKSVREVVFDELDVHLRARGCGSQNCQHDRKSDLLNHGDLLS